MNLNLDLTDERWNVRKEDAPRQRFLREQKKVNYDGVRYAVGFKNSEYGVSIIKNYGSYGYEDDQWEIALLKNDKLYHRLHEDFDMLDDVIGHLTDDEVREWIEKFYDIYVLGNDLEIKIHRIQKQIYQIGLEIEQLKEDLNEIDFKVKRP